MKPEIKQKLSIQAKKYSASTLMRNNTIDAISSLAYYLVQDSSGTKALKRLEEIKKRKYLKIENQEHENWIWRMAETIAYPPQEIWGK